MSLLLVTTNVVLLTQTIGVAGAEAFGASAERTTAKQSGLVSVGTFGASSAADVATQSSAVPSVEAFGSDAIGAKVAQAGLTTLEGFGASAERTTAKQSGLASIGTFGTSSAADVATQVVSIASVEVFGSSFEGSTFEQSDGAFVATVFGTDAIETSVRSVDVLSDETFGISRGVVELSNIVGMDTSETFHNAGSECGLDQLGASSVEAFGNDLASTMILNSFEISYGGSVGDDAIVSAISQSSSVSSEDAFGTCFENVALGTGDDAAFGAFGSNDERTSVFTDGIPQDTAFGATSLSAETGAQSSFVEADETALNRSVVRRRRSQRYRAFDVRHALLDDSVRRREELENDVLRDWFGRNVVVSVRRVSAGGKRSMTETVGRDSHEVHRSSASVSAELLAFVGGTGNVLVDATLICQHCGSECGRRVV